MQLIINKIKILPSFVDITNVFEGTLPNVYFGGNEMFPNIIEHNTLGITKEEARKQLEAQGCDIEKVIKVTNAKLILLEEGYSIAPQTNLKYVEDITGEKDQYKQEYALSKALSSNEFAEIIIKHQKEVKEW